MTESNSTVHVQMKRIRTSKQLTQEVVAERAGISLLTYGRIERGERDLVTSLLKKIAAAMETPVSEFFVEEINLDKPNLREVRCHLHEFIPMADEATLLRWYGESL